MRIYFCSDVHASRKCWKKFLASAKFYNADMIIVGGGALAPRWRLGRPLMFQRGSSASRSFTP